MIYLIEYVHLDRDGYDKSRHVICYSDDFSKAEEYIRNHRKEENVVGGYIYRITRVNNVTEVK